MPDTTKPFPKPSEHTPTMNSICSNSTISTTASLRCSISSKSMLRSSDHLSTSAFKASRNAKYKVNNRWRATTRRESSLTSLMKKPKRASRNQIISNTSLSSNLGRGLQGLRLGSIGKFNNEDFNKDAPFGEIYCSTISTNSDIVIPPPICIKSAELNRALHRDIDLQMTSNPEEDKLHLKERWSAKSEKGGSPLYKPTRRNSGENLR